MGLPVAVVMGAGDGLGGAITRRFAAEGHHVVAVRRSADKLEPLAKQVRDAGGELTTLGVDGRDEDQVVELFERVERDLGEVDVAVHNIGANVSFSILEFETRKYRKIWEMACLSGFLLGREAARRMTPRGRGTILFTGATASLRGKQGMAGFAGAKHALRALAQSMARELGPQGVHVGHVIIDGPIDMPWIHENFPQLAESRPADGLLKPDDIADGYLMLHRQARSAWTHELDLRPWVEPW